MNQITGKKSSTTVILEAVQELHALEQIVTRETLAQITGLKLTIIDDRIATLVDDELVIRVQRGVFVPAQTFPAARPISKTVLPSGMVKVEIGDDVLTLTPREDRALASLQAGTAVQMANIESGHQAAVLAGDLARTVRRLEREIAGYRARVDAAQLELIPVKQD